MVTKMKIIRSINVSKQNKNLSKQVKFVYFHFCFSSSVFFQPQRLMFHVRCVFYYIFFFFFLSFHFSSLFFFFCLHSFCSRLQSRQSAIHDYYYYDLYRNKKQPATSIHKWNLIYFRFFFFFISMQNYF